MPGLGVNAAVLAEVGTVTCLRAAGQEMCFHALPVAESFLDPFRHHTLYIGNEQN
jgi:hypothetical protein